MKKSIVIVLLVLVAAAASAATVGVQKLMQKGWGAAGGDIVVITDARCKECDTSRLETTFKTTFPDAKIQTLDYGKPDGKKLYEKEGISLLPAVLLPKGYAQKEGFKRFEQFAKLKDDYYVLAAGGKFDPKAEICDNGTDDNGDKLVDCADPTCKSNWRCMEKKEKPEVDVFVMSHCPFGTQIEKGILPVWDLLGDKIDLNIRYVGYAMHGKKEVDEELRQYCVLQQGKQKLREYLGCFLESGDTGDKCVNAAKVDSKALADCTKASDAKFGVTKAFEDKSKWQGQFPPFPIDAELAKKYGVAGSPTLVINGVVARADRSPKALLDAICTAFKDRPKECDKALDAASPAPGFGNKTAPAQGPGAPAQPKCGG
jgi:hypothetical protein